MARRHTLASLARVAQACERYFPSVNQELQVLLWDPAALPEVVVTRWNSAWGRKANLDMAKKVIYSATVILFLGVALAFALKRHSEASILEWELNNHVPTSDINLSRNWGIFERAVSFQDSNFVIAGVRYQAVEAWLEHWAEPKSENMFTTRKIIHPELILCIRIKSPDVAFPERQLRIKNANTDKIGGIAAGNVMFAMVGQKLPERVIFCDEANLQEAYLTIVQ